MYKTLRAIGLLRFALLFIALIDVLLMPAPRAEVITDDIRVFSTLVAPAAAPLIAMVILFDIMMSFVRASDSDGIERKNFKTIARLEIAAVAIMVLLWLPYFMALGK